MSLLAAVRRAAQIRGEGIAIIDGERRFTWREFSERVARLAAGFVSLGLRPGARVVFLGTNSHRSIESFYAAIHAGSIVVPLNHRLSDDELTAQVRDCAPDLAVLDGNFAERAGLLRRAAANSLRALLYAGETAGKGFDCSSECLIRDHRPHPDAEPDGNGIACLYYTGGTTGVAKGVMLSHANLLANAANTIPELGLDEDTRHLHHGPLFHLAAGARLFTVTQVAGTHVFLPRFTAKGVLEEIARSRITHTTLVPSMMRMLLDQPDFESFDLSTLRYVSYGGAPAAESLVREIVTRLPHVRFVQSYGMTELSPVATMLGWRDHRPENWNSGKLRSAGQPVMFGEVAIRQADGNWAPIGETGEIVVRGPQVMRGYWNKPESTADTIRDGWLHTGDAGYLDENGYLFVVDRIKDMIISGGENVYSLEVENAIVSHPAVSQCAVIGRPHPLWGETVHAVVTLFPSEAATPEELVAHCRSLIGHYKCPRSIDIRDDPMPLSGANKILKSQLKAELREREPSGLETTQPGGPS